MKRSIGSILAVVLSMPLLWGQYSIREAKAFRCKVKNSEKREVKDLAVVIQLEDAAKTVRWEVRDAAGSVVPFQLDDLNDDKQWDELLFLAQLQPNRESIYSFAPSSGEEPQFTPRVHAQLLLKTDDKRIVPVREAASDKDNMYKKLHHHGPAFESELAAYRIYFDKKQTIDIYAKKQYRLEVEESGWYPNEEQLARGFGDDVLVVRGAVGLGTLKGWNPTAKCAEHIEKMDERKMVVRASGPLRTVVDVEVEGWEYNGQKIDLLSRYELFAGQRDVHVRHHIRGQRPQELIFCTGVQRMPEEGFMSKGGLMAVWGRDWPVTDTVKYAKETVGLSVFVPRSIIKEETSDKVNYLYLIRPDERGEMAYRFAFFSCKEPLLIRSAQEFFRWVPSVYNVPRVRVAIEPLSSF